VNAIDDKRVNHLLRLRVDAACDGILPCVADKIRHLVRQAYWLGIQEGLEAGADPGPEPDPDWVRGPEPMLDQP